MARETLGAHPVLHPELLSRCREAIERTADAPPSSGDGGSAKRSWAAALDALQGNSLAALVAEAAPWYVTVLDPELNALPSTDTEHQRILRALAAIGELSPAVLGLLEAYVVGIVVVHRSSPCPSGLESSVDVRAATRDHWRPGMGRFVGSSTGHIGLLWVEAGLSEGDLVCGIVHEFAHLALNLVDMAAGVFTSAAYDGSLLAPSPAVPDARGRPYAMAMHALVVKSALGHLGLRMSTDPPGAFDFHAFAPGFLAAADEGLTAQGRALFQAICALEGNGLEVGGLRLTTGKVTVRRYATAHAEPVLLFWSIGFKQEEWQLCYEVADDGAVVFDGLRAKRMTHTSEYSDEAEELDFGTDKKPFSCPLEGLPCGGRLRSLRSCPSDFTVRVEDPWNTKFDDVSADFDFVNVNERYGQSRLFLPNGQQYGGWEARLARRPWMDHAPGPWDEFVPAEEAEEAEPPEQTDAPALTVAEACGLPPLRVVQVFGSPAADHAIEVRCLGVDGGLLADVTETDATPFRHVQAKLASALGTKIGLLRLITKGGVQLGAAHWDRTLAELFPCSEEGV